MSQTHQLRWTRLQPGADIEVKTRFLASWTTGFQLAAIDDDGVWIRRRSDGAVLPVSVPFTDVRPA